MAPKRSTRASSTTKPETATATSPQHLVTNENEQRRMFILPQGFSEESRIITLLNPARKSRCRYFFCPEAGLFEFTKVTAAPYESRSWLIISEHQNGAETSMQCLSVDQSEQNGYVLQDPNLFLATPIDALFFLTPLFDPIIKGQRASFRLEDDYMDILTDQSAELASALRLPGFRALLVKRLRTISSVQEFGEDVLLKLDKLFLANVILDKARRMIAAGVWPQSMEEAFVKKQLEIPLASILEGNPQLPTPEQSITASDLESQASDVPSVELETASASITLAQSSSDVPLEVERLMRLRVALRYITSAYLPKDVRDNILSAIESEKLVDFSPLDEHLQRVQDANAEVQARRALTDNISRKRSAMEDDEAEEARAEKRRKKEEDERRNKSESRGIKQLKKADTSGMKKLSSFFAKPAVQAKSK